MIFYSPEAGYFDASDVRDTRHGLVAVDADGEWIGYVEPAPCDICGGAIPADARDPLCTLHKGSSREGGRALAEQQRYERDVGGGPG